MAPDEIRTRAFSIATQRKVFSRDRVCEEIEKLVAEASRSDEATPMKSPDRDAADELAKPCTCHPDDNPPVPCAQKYALTDCKASELATLRRRVEQGGAAIDALEKEKEIYRARWLACITPEEGERLRSELAAACRRVAELDSIINYWGGDNDDVVAPEDGERICSEAIARHRATAPLPPGRNEG